jgi:ABC-type microcin C transport system permease subunit YejE
MKMTLKRKKRRKTMMSLIIMLLLVVPTGSAEYISNPEVPIMLNRRART